MASRSESIFTLGDAKAFLQCATGGGVLNRLFDTWVKVFLNGIGG